MQAIKLDEFLNYHFLSNVKLSPSADKAAFVVSKSNEEKDGYTSGIWTVDLNTKECRMLTAGKDESSFLWLNDDTLLLWLVLLNYQQYLELLFARILSLRKVFVILPKSSPLLILDTYFLPYYLHQQ